MDRSFYEENRKALYASLTPGSALVMFSGHAPRKTADEMYPFFADRSFVYFTGIEQEDIVFLAKIIKVSKIYELVSLVKDILQFERKHSSVPECTL